MAFTKNQEPILMIKRLIFSFLKFSILEFSHIISRSILGHRIARTILDNCGLLLTLFPFQFFRSKI